MSVRGAANRDLNRDRALAAALVINAANALKRPDDGLAAFARFDDNPDPAGLANRAAAESALLSGDLANADRWLDRAMREATKNGSIPSDFHILKARIYETRAGLKLKTHKPMRACLKEQQVHTSAPYAEATRAPPSPSIWPAYSATLP